MNIKISFPVSLFLLLTLWCSAVFADDNTYNEKNTSIIISNDNPRFTIKLISNRTTGYSWALRKYDPKLIKLLKHQYIKSPSPLMGASGYEVWTFRARVYAFKPEMKTKIKMAYSRPWQENTNKNYPKTIKKLIIFTVGVE